jgi:aspartyl-tRNA(Asn)/glutamyl-tRNA(Gln) amidotransferase subunit C
MALSPEEVRKIAQLARLAITDEEVEKFAGQLSSILDYIERLNQLDTENVQPTSYTSGLGTPLREDVAVEDRSREVIIPNAPDSEGPLFKVPKVI